MSELNRQRDQQSFGGAIDGSFEDPGLLRKFAKATSELARGGLDPTDWGQPKKVGDRAIQNMIKRLVTNIRAMTISYHKPKEFLRGQPWKQQRTCLNL